MATKRILTHRPVPSPVVEHDLNPAKVRRIEPRAEDIIINTETARAVLPKKILDVPVHALPPSIFSPQSINLAVGSGGTGKTTMLLCQLDQYLMDRESPFLGMPLPADATPAQCAAIIAVRGRKAYQREIEHLDLTAVSDPNVYPTMDWRLTDDPERDFVSDLIQHHEELSNRVERAVELLVIEGLQNIMPRKFSRINPNDVVDFYKLLREFVETRNCAIIGTVGCPKQKMSDKFVYKRDRTSGCTEWSAQADTVLNIDQVDLNMDEDQRRGRRYVTIHGSAYRRDDSDIRNTLLSCFFDFNEVGKQVIINPTDEDQTSPAESCLDHIWAGQDAGTVKTRPEWIAIAETSGIPERTADRWLASRSDPAMGMLERISGTRPRQYRKP